MTTEYVAACLVTKDGRTAIEDRRIQAKSPDDAKTMLATNASIQRVVAVSHAEAL